MVWFQLCKVQKQARLICAVRRLTSDSCHGESDWKGGLGELVTSYFLIWMLVKYGSSLCELPPSGTLIVYALSYIYIIINKTFFFFKSLWATLVPSSKLPVTTPRCHYPPPQANKRTKGTVDCRLKESRRQIFSAHRYNLYTERWWNWCSEFSDSWKEGIHCKEAWQNCKQEM